VNYVVVPGIDGSADGHWQSHWEASWTSAGLAAARIAPSSWTEPELGDWTDAIAAAVAAMSTEDCVLVAHSLGCLAVAHWLAHGGPARGALLVGPPDVHGRQFPAAAAPSFKVLAPTPLPVPALVVASDDDPYCDPAAAARLANGWAAALVRVGPRGHLNEASGLGPWDAGRGLLTAFETALASGVHIGLSDPRTPDVTDLLRRHLQLMHAVTPAGHVHALNLEPLTASDVDFFTARSGGTLLGMGALRYLDSGHAEIKSMHTTQDARGRGIGRAMLTHLLAVAAARGCRRISLETGTMPAFEPARALYLAAGFVPCPPFGEYSDNPHSVCMTRPL
jgi:serine hydrolase